MQFSTKIDGFEQKDSQGFENSYKYNSYEQYPLEKFLIFTIYQNYTLALSLSYLTDTSIIHNNYVTSHCICKQTNQSASFIFFFYLGGVAWAEMRCVMTLFTCAYVRVAQFPLSTRRVS